MSRPYPVLEPVTGARRMGGGRLGVRGGGAEVEGGPRQMPRGQRVALYTPEQRRRRDATRWTLVQGVLAPLQFVVFAWSVALVLRWFATGEGLWWANASIVLKTAILYTIMVTGAAWERAVFGRWLFAPAFFWEDVVSMVVILLHTAYLALLLDGTSSPRTLLLLALVAYATYAINAAQFVLKLRAARRQEAA